MSTRTTFKYDEQGKVTERIDEELTMVAMIMDEMREKNLAWGWAGWFFKIIWTFGNSEDWIPNITLMGGNINKWHISLKDDGSSDKIAEAIAAARKDDLNIGVGPNGANIKDVNDGK